MFQGIQKVIVTAFVPLIKMAISFANGGLQNQDFKGYILDDLCLLGHSMCSLSIKRRYTLKPHILKEYKNLVSAEVPITKFLFDNDVNKRLKDIKYLGGITVASDRYSSSRSRDLNFRGPARGHGTYRYREVYRPYPQGQRFSSQGRSWKPRTGQNSNNNLNSQ